MNAALESLKHSVSEMIALYAGEEGGKTNIVTPHTITLSLIHVVIWNATHRVRLLQ